MPMEVHNSVKPKKLVGIVGGAASGKDTVAEIFASTGYSHVSSSDLVRENIRSRGLSTSRALQTEIANEMRFNHGPGYWVDLSLSNLDLKETKIVVSGLYSPGEGEHLIKNLGGILVGVVTPDHNDLNKRYERLVARSNGQRDKLNFDEFKSAHNRENSGLMKHDVNIAELMKMSAFIINNSSDLDHLTTETLRVVTDIDRI